MFTLRQRSVLPGFDLTMGFTLVYLGLIVLIPLAGTFIKTSSLGWEQFWSRVYYFDALLAVAGNRIR